MEGKKYSFMQEVKREVMLDYALEGMLNVVDFLETKEPAFLKNITKCNNGYVEASQIKFNVNGNQI